MNGIIIKIEPDRIFARYSLLCGIVGLVVGFTSFQGMYEAFVFGVAAVTLAILSGNKGRRRGAAKAGLVTGIVTVLFSGFKYYGLAMFFRFVRDPALRPQFLAAFQQMLAAYGLSLDDFLMVLRMGR